MAAEGMIADKDAVKNLLDWAVRENGAYLASLVDFPVHCRPYIPPDASKGHRMMILIRKLMIFYWSFDAQLGSEQIKDDLLKAVALALPSDDERRLLVDAGARNFGLS